MAPTEKKGQTNAANNVVTYGSGGGEILSHQPGQIADPNEVLFVGDEPSPKPEPPPVEIVPSNPDPSASGIVPLTSPPVAELHSEARGECEKQEQELQRFARELDRHVAEIQSRLAAAQADPSQERELLRQGVGEACVALTSIMETRHLLEAIRVLGRLATPTAQYQQALMSLEAFLQAERNVLQELEIPPQRQDEILAECGKIVTNLSKGQRQRAPTVMKSIRRLQESTCSLQDIEEPVKKDHRRADLKKVLVRAGRGITGVTLVVGNASALSGYGPVFVQISGVVGAEMIKSAVDFE